MTMQEAYQRSVVIGTAGHIDHGKTSLVLALTGVDTDRLPEEKRRGMTVDLGFASFDVLAGAGQRLRIDVVDVPGHKQFIRNMLAGAAGIDAVMLVISAQEEVKPQTEEHLAICGLLGITRGLTVLTKSDLIREAEIAGVCDRVREALMGSFLESAPIVPVSARSGYGMESLRRELARLSEEIQLRSTSGLPRLPVDRSFVMRGFGTVVTGTLNSGRVFAGQTLMVEPGGKQVRVRGLQRQGRSHGEALAGSRVALNLSGVEVGEVGRGSTLVAPRTLHAVDRFDAEVSLLSGSPELPHRAKVRLHAYASESVATVLIYGDRTVPSGESRIVRLRLASPLLVVPGDRFVLRRLSPGETIGGGRVLDAHPGAGTRRRTAQAWLEEIRDAPPERQLQLRTERRGSAGISLSELAREIGWSSEAVEASVQGMLLNGSVRLLQHNVLVASRALQEAGDAVVKLLGSSTEQRNSALGMRRSDLHQQAHLSAEVFGACLEMLVAQQRLVVAGEPGQERVYPAGVRPEIRGADRDNIEVLAELYRRAALNPPAFSQVLNELRWREKDARAYITSLLREKTLIKIAAADVFMHREAIEALESRVRALKKQTLDVGRLKEMTGLSRKYVIPLLEHLDRQRITRRQGDTRIVL